MEDTQQAAELILLHHLQTTAVNQVLKEVHRLNVIANPVKLAVVVERVVSRI
jgi:hypothetical protein